MSISNPSLENPCKKFIDFNGDSGTFSYYDKETEKKVLIPMPIYFIVLDELTTITGYNKKNDCGIYSNEVHRTSDELLKVKSFKGGEEVIGYYSDIKDSIVALGGKYTKSVYALLINQDHSTEFVNFKFKGSSFSGWLEKKFNVSKSVVGITGMRDEVNGKITYKVPLFQKFKMTEELREEAVLLDAVLQEYLSEYKTRAPKASEVNPLTNTVKADSPEEFIANQRTNKGNQFPASENKGFSPSETVAEKNQRLKDELPPEEFTQDELSDLPF